MKEELKMKILDFIYSGKGITHYKRSYKHPLIGRTFFGLQEGYVTVTKIWNVKVRNNICQFSYEEDKNISWGIKVEFTNNEGKFVYPLTIFLTRMSNEDGSKIDDENLYDFYK